MQSHRICHFFLGKMDNQMHCFRTGRGARRSNFTLSLEGILMRDKSRWLWGLITFPFWKLSRVGLAPLSQPTEIRSLANFNTPFSRQGCSLSPRYADLGPQYSSSLACSWTQRPPVLLLFTARTRYSSPYLRLTYVMGWVSRSSFFAHLAVFWLKQVSAGLLVMVHIGHLCPACAIE